MSTEIEMLDRYTISVEERSGFPEVILRLSTSKGMTAAYEIHPALAHALSDELLQATVHALPKSTK
jgi:hypothetical protein